MTRESLPFQTPRGDSGERGSGREGFLTPLRRKTEDLLAVIQNGHFKMETTRSNS